MYHNIEYLRPDQLEQIVKDTPIAYWPLGLIEHHGWHLPIGFDGIKAREFCKKVASKTGGLMLPTFWWGGLGGHGDFLWTFYQDPEAAETIVTDTVQKLIDYGIKVIVLFYGHYPWEALIHRTNRLKTIIQKYPEVTIIEGTEISIANGPNETIPAGDHAARQETTYGLHLFPELIDMGALTPGRSVDQAWGKQTCPAKELQHPGVDFDASSPFFAQMGESPLLCRPIESEVQSQYIIDTLILKVKQAKER